VTKENPHTGETVRATTAYLTLVGIDANKRPTPIPPLRPETPDELRRHENARLRVEARRALVQKLRARAIQPKG
jgi:acyl-CoA hydrolase